MGRLGGGGGRVAGVLWVFRAYFLNKLVQGLRLWNLIFSSLIISSCSLFLHYIFLIFQNRHLIATVEVRLGKMNADEKSQLKVFRLLELKLPYNPVCLSVRRVGWLVGRSVGLSLCLTCHTFLKGLKVCMSSFPIRAESFTSMLLSVHLYVIYVMYILFVLILYFYGFIS